jgi:hypothetical protein
LDVETADDDHEEEHDFLRPRTSTSTDSHLQSSSTESRAGKKIQKKKPEVVDLLSQMLEDNRRKDKDWEK